jgi:predicted CXXCH cytochrome family protein
MRHRELSSVLAGACVAVLLSVVLLVIPSGEAGDFRASSHKDISCTTCHSIVADVDGAAFPVPDFSLRCRGCHTRMEEVDKRTGLTFHTRNPRPCVECHSFHKPEALLAGDRLFVMSYSSQSRLTGCYACHGQSENTSNLSPGHLAAARIFHTDYKLVSGFSPSELCLVCHAENASIPADVLPEGSSAPKFSDHSNHPVGVPVMLGGGSGQARIRTEIDVRLRLFTGRIECQTCHSLSTPNRGHLVSFKTKADLCLGCHQIG